jgi:hypothetical protein
MTSYLDVETLFPRFGLPLRLDGADDAGPAPMTSGSTAGPSQ